MEILKQRAAVAISLFETVEVGVETVGDLLRASFLACQRERGAEENRAESPEKLDPGLLAAAFTCRSERQVLDVEGAEIAVDLLGRGGRLLRKPPGGAAMEDRGELLLGELPALGTPLRIETRDRARVAVLKLLERAGAPHRRSFGPTVRWHSENRSFDAVARS